MKKRMVFIGIFGVCLILGVFWWVESRTPTLIIEPQQFEYGVPIEINTQSMLDTTDPHIIESITIDTTSFVYGEGKSYPEVGVYTLPFHYKVLYMEKQGTLTVEINDTISPVFTKETPSFEFTEDEVNADYNFAQHFEVDDLSEVALTVDTTAVDFNEPGTYKAKITALDTHHNASHCEFDVVIKKKKGVVVQPEPTPKPNNPSCKTPDTVQDPQLISGHIVVNKKHPLPRSYAPGENASAGQSARKMIADMQALGFDISSSYSGYRSFDYQGQLYRNYVRTSGQTEAERFSARPGYSEHQTGLAFDLKHKNGALVEHEPEVSWIASHAHTYGFIVRYQQQTESVTGYMYEPWHLRYVGKDATAIYNSGLTLEAYLGFEGGNYCGE